MQSIITTHPSRRTTAKTTGAIQRASIDPQRPSRALGSIDDYFWYTATDGVARLATCSGALNEIPQQVNNYIFNASLFAHDQYPSTLPSGRTWPPRQIRDLAFATGPEGDECVGDKCCTGTICEDSMCRHTFENWRTATQSWKDHFELRKTEDRGIGVYTRQAFKEGDVLGWYAGDIVSDKHLHGNNDYLMELPIGVTQTADCPSTYNSDSGYASSPSPPTTPIFPEESVLIDASRNGNWTRFINHSCDSYAGFRMRRVGNVRIIAVEAVKDIPADIELTVSYGLDYYGPRTKKICYCGSKCCVSRYRKEKSGDMWGTEKRRTKKCRRLAPWEN